MPTLLTCSSSKSSPTHTPPEKSQPCPTPSIYLPWSFRQLSRACPSLLGDKHPWPSGPITMQQSTTFAEPQQPSPLGPHVHGTHLLVTATLHRRSLHLAYHCLHHLRVHLGPHSGRHNVTALDMLVPQDKPTQYSTRQITTCPPSSVFLL